MRMRYVTSVTAAVTLSLACGTGTAPAQRSAEASAAPSAETPSRSKRAGDLAASSEITANSSTPLTDIKKGAAIESDGHLAEPASVPADAAPPSHAPFSSLLAEYVTPAGAVDYAGFKTQHAKLKVYLETLSRGLPDDTWTRDEALAYWINAYNAATLDLVLDNYPLNSIKDLDGGKPWDVKRVKLGGTSYSLNGIENEVIRPIFREPRIHFAVNCAAKGCPPLRDEAYVADRLDAQLEEQTRKFLNDPAFTKVSGDTLTVSKIFDWYGSDFGDVVDYVRPYRQNVPEGARVEFSAYDWSLNAR